ncbi:MAG: transketolase [Firmicutes bacterium]|nr:transketolase [Bacillota bacterium]
MANKNETAINSIKMLALDMINKAGSGHPGIVLGATPVLCSLYLNELNVLANKPNWMNRDRFVLSAGHGSAMLYSLLHFAGFDISLDDLKRFRDVDSFTPGHPEVNETLGVDCSSGPLGEGVATAVGMALAERYFENICRSVDKKSNLVDYYTYVLCGDGDLQEGISYEALSFASAQKLKKLIIIYDSNKVQLDGEVKNTFTEEVEERFEALDFNVITVKNGSSVSDITSALKDARKSDMPSIIIVNTKIGKDALNEGTNEIHGKPLSNEEILNLKQKYKLSLDPFSYSEEVKNYVTDTIIKRVNKKYENWLREYNLAKESRNKDLVGIINLIEKGEFFVDFDSTNYQINEKYCEEGRLSNQKAMNFIAPKTRFFLGGSADLSSSTKTIIDKSGLMSHENPTGRNIPFGVRENAMGAILNGMALSGLRVYGSTFLTFADYLKPSLRMSAMMKLPVTYIFTHDSVSIGGDGPTHQPIEQLTMLRSTPNMTVFRPADINEIIGAWEYILKNKETVSIVLSKEKLNIQKHTNGKYVKYGAYIVRKEKYRLDGIIIATGSEVSTALKIAEELFTQGIDLRIVSMPSMELFLKQNPVYEEKLLPKEVKTITLEAGSTVMWHRFASSSKCILGIDTYGVSGKKEDVLKFVGFDYNSLLMKIKNMFESN